MNDKHTISIWKEGSGFRLMGYVYIQSNNRAFEHSTLLSEADIVSIFGKQFLDNLYLFVEWPVEVAINPVIYVQATQEILQNLVMAKEASRQV